MHYVFLLNQDAYLTDNCLNRLIKIQQNNTEYGILSPFHYKGSFTGLDDNFVMYMSRYKVSRDYIFDANEGNIKEVYSIPFVNAAGWLIPKRTLESVGYFDSLFFHYGEDRNYCQRVLYHNMKIGIVRFGNVFDSFGSVSEIFKNKILILNLNFFSINRFLLSSKTNVTKKFL